MKFKIAVDPVLTHIRSYLDEKGYNVESLSLSDRSLHKFRGYSAIVVSGVNTNLLGIQDTETKAVVINADGRTPEEVAREIEDIESINDLK